MFKKVRQWESEDTTCIIHKFTKFWVLCSKVFWIFGFKMLFFKKRLKPGRIILDLVNDPGSVPLGTKYL